MPEGSSTRSRRSSRHQSTSSPSSSPSTPRASRRYSSMSATAAKSTPRRSRTLPVKGLAAASTSRARTSLVESSCTASSSRSRSETSSSASRTRRTRLTSMPRSLQRVRRSSAGRSATSAAANESQSWPPSGRRSRTTLTPSAVAEKAKAGKIASIATSIGCEPSRSRQTAGRSAAVTSRYEPATRSNGIALNSTDSVAVLTDVRMVRLRVARMGLSAHCRGRAAALASPLHWASANRGLWRWSWRCGEHSRRLASSTPRVASLLFAPAQVPGGRRRRGYTGLRMVEKVLLASPRGYCAGVERAVESVERALELYGAPVYVRKQIVHNLHVVRELEERGAIFVEDENDVPEGQTVVFSAHGIAPSVLANSAARQLQTIDATCPLVTKVHVQARRYAADGYTVILIGHAGHEEVVGTMGEAPDRIVLVESVEDVDALDYPPDAKLAYITQTTLSVDETSEVIAALRGRFPSIYAPKKEDICYATSNRQWAVKEMLTEIDLLLVIGSRNSSNSNRLVEVARAGGVAAHLIDDETEIDPAWIEDSMEVVGVTSGA